MNPSSTLLQNWLGRNLFASTAISSSIRVLSMLAMAAALGFPTGCTDGSAKRLESFQTSQAAGKEKRDSIKEAFRYLPQLIRLDRSAALREIQYQMNTWSKSAKALDSWKAPEMLQTVPVALRTLDLAKRLDKLEFGEPECEYLLQCQMLTKLSKWVLDRPYRDRLFLAWLQKKKETFSADDWNQLEITLKLFDWTVCNVGVDGQPNDVEKLVSYPESPLSDTAPVYRQLPWQTLMFARGDVWQRARVFTQLAFANGVDCVALALPSESGATENASLRLWCIGVPIGKSIYLFEPHWGLPIPSQTDDGIATLQEARENPNVLRRAKIPGFFEYPVEQKDLGTVVALMDLEPFATSQSMHILEKSLTGDNRMRIASNSDTFEERLKSIDPKLAIRHWNAPWLAHAYNLSLRSRLDEQSPFSMTYVGNYGAYISDTPISQARNLHLLGNFNTSIEATGALKSYMDVRVDEQTLKKLETDKDTQASLGIVRRPNQPLEVFQMQIKQSQIFFRRSKFDVAMFLGMANFDLEKLDTSIDWLTTRLLKLQGTEKWHAQAHYLVGRALEEKGKVAEAIEEYKFDKSPQAAGNRIRIRKLNAALESK
jgi:hypothetical protein